MKCILGAIIIFLVLQSCRDDVYDAHAALDRIPLVQQDLNNFTKLRARLIKDYVAIRKEYEKVAPGYNGNGWISTNSYYLNKIDSTGYISLLTPLKGKCSDNFYINDFGKVVFVLKHYAQLKYGDYNNCWDHRLYTPNDKQKPDSSSAHDEGVILDSVINDEWKYRIVTFHSGH